MREDDRLDMVRRELQALLRREARVTERDLLRLSARTGVEYSTVVRIQRELS